VEAETALSKGITAEKSGTVVEALSYYYNAASFDPTLAEAAGRLNVLSGTVSGGNIGENVRSEIQRREEWLKVINEAAAFFKNHPPYEIVYDPALSEGEIDFQKKTVELSFSLALHSTPDLEIVNNILEGLDKTGKRKDWGFAGSSWPFAGNGDIKKILDSRPDITVEAEILNDKGKIIAATGKKELSIYYSWNNTVRTLLYTQGEDRAINHISGISQEYRLAFTVKAADISDTMTVRITKINGKDAAAAGRAGYIKISSAGTLYKTGDKGPAGGIIFYTMGGTGWRYLEAAPGDLPDAPWAARGSSYVAGTEYRAGSGKNNTQRIGSRLGEAGAAARLCAGYELNGYRDWFLPSWEELILMYNRLKSQGLGNLQNKEYWSSSRADHDLTGGGAKKVDFGTGFDRFGGATDESLGVRPIRAF
jgi:hypothetical protein